MKINLNHLPKYSDVLRSLLENNPGKKIIKTKEEVIREFGEEKWKKILGLINLQPSITVSELEALTTSGQELFYERGNFYYITQKMIQKRILHYEASYLEMFSEGCSLRLVEVGAGYGSKILNLGRFEFFKSYELFAGDLTRTGVDIIRVLGRNGGQEVEVFECDLVGGYLDKEVRALDGLAFTSYAAHYQDPITFDFFGIFRALGVKRVINFEPIYELHNTDTLHGILSRRYIENNGYTRNLLEVLKAGESANICKIVKITPNLFGHAHLPVSVVVWDFV